MKVVVLLGGPSAEREVSLASGRAVAESLRRLGHEVVEIDPSSVEESVAPPGHLSFLGAPGFSGCDAVFVALHGEVGEDGRVQAVLDLAGVPYTGSGALASALSMNKDLSKKIFLSQGIPTPEWMLLSGRDGSESDPGLGPPGPASLGGFPVVVKPNDQGSTIGLTIVKNQGEFPAAVRKAAGYSDEIMVERYIPGREITVSVLGSEALPVVEIIPEGGLYDYTRKYTKGASRYVVPAELDSDLETRVKDLGMRCFSALGCRGFGRVDMRLSPGNDVFCLEVNTVPGMTETSLVPMAAGALGVSFDEMIKRILESAGLDGPSQRGKSELKNL
jgi:D-alanine-D-alanine ligase